MAYEPKDGSGALFRNDKGDNPARPDYRGDLMVGGVLYEVSGWIKPLPSNPEKRFMSLAAKPKIARQPEKTASMMAPSELRQTSQQRPRGTVLTQQPQPKQGHGFETMDDDVPW